MFPSGKGVSLSVSGGTHLCRWFPSTGRVLVQMQAEDFEVASGQLVVEVEVSGLFVVVVYFVLFPDEKGVFVVDAVDVSL